MTEYHDQLPSWTHIDPRVDFTFAEQQQLIADLENELRRRDFTPGTVSYLISAPGHSHGITVSARNEKSEYTYGSALVGDSYTNELDKLLPQLQIMLDEKFPPLPRRLEEQFTEAFDKLAQIADKLGETIPSYNAFAAALRESQRSNLLNAPWPSPEEEPKNES